MDKGILLPIFSLPSNYGIGDFGYEAYEFIDILSENGIKYWEILPINAGYESPYSPFSFYALEENFISIDKLIDMDLIKREEVKYKTKNKRIRYDNFKDYMIRIAFNRFIPNAEYEKFIEKRQIREYAKFMVEKYNDTDPEEFYLFEQYILDKQYKELKKYANSKNVKIIGDMPVYPNFFSSEVMFYGKYYQLKEGKPIWVSGAPPDSFNPEGQRWNHPVYNIDEIKKDNYKYILDRYKEYLTRFDIIRLDHFIGYDHFYKIPFDKTAKFGIYEKGLGEEFFRKLFEFTDSYRFIAEDLGAVRLETEKLRDEFHITKTKLLEFSLSKEEPKDDFEDSKNMVCYTGNHDTNTLVGWQEELTRKEISNIIDFLKQNNCYNGKFNESIIKYALKGKAQIAIFPIQDVMGLNGNSRINIPGKELHDNWSWELLDFELFRKKVKMLDD